MNFFVKSSGVVLLVSTVCACSPVMPTPETERTRSGMYDGYWQGEVVSDRDIQQHGRVQFHCGKYTADFSAEIKAGELQGLIEFQSGEKHTLHAYVTDAGYFLGEILTDDAYTLNDLYKGPKIRYLVSATLDPQKHVGSGRLVMAEGTDSVGCTADLLLERDSDS